MKRFIALSLLLIAAPSFAQVTSTSSTQVQSGSVAGASNNGVSLDSANYFGASDGVRYSGHYTVHANPGTSNGGAAAGFSGNNCGNTGQKSLSAMIASGATMYTIESVPCNLRSSAELAFKMGDEYDRKGQPGIADAVRSLGAVALCQSLQEVDPNALHNCKLLGLIKDGQNGDVSKPTPIVYLRTPEVIPSRPAGWTNKDLVEPTNVDKTKTPATHDSGWVEPTH